MSLGIELKQLRANKKWTQAFAAREIGIQQSYLSKLENGQFIPSAELIEKLEFCYKKAVCKFNYAHYWSRNVVMRNL